MPRQNPYSASLRQLTERAFNRLSANECIYCGRQQAKDLLHEVNVTTGSMDDPARFPPTEESFAEARLPWLKALGS